MGDAGRLSVTPADLVTHAGNVDRVADGIALARQAAETCRPTADAYGRLCVMVPMLLSGLQDLMVDGMTAGEGSLRESARRVRDAADRYRSTDTGNAAGIEAAGSGGRS